MQALIKSGAKYTAPDPGLEVVKKEIVSAKTGKVIKKAGGQKKVRFRYTYADLSTWESDAVKPTRAELNLFKSVSTMDKRAAVDDPQALQASKNSKDLVFNRSLTVEKGGAVKTTREAVAKLLGSFTIPSKGFFEVVLYWKVYSDKDKTKVLDAPPSKRFVVDAAAMRRGYGQFLKHIKALKIGDLEDDLGMDLDEIKEEAPGLLKDFLKNEAAKGQFPKNSTAAFIEKQILGMAQGRGVYISDKKGFGTFHGKSKRGKRNKSMQVSQAVVSDLTMLVYKTTKPKRKTGI
jgi:predicted RNA-binding protein YlxR (DUF448 family)